MDRLRAKSSSDTEFPTRDTHPLLFAAAAMIELAAFWMYRGFDVGGSRSPASPPEHKRKTMTPKQIREYTESVAEIMHDEYRAGILKLLSDPQHNLTYLVPTLEFVIGPPPSTTGTSSATAAAATAAAATAAPTPVKKPSLRILRLNCMRCTYAQCGQHENLKKCQRCQCAKYCCKEHQKLDWPRHKVFCGLMG
jgi:hypothetical protein